MQQIKAVMWAADGVMATELASTFSLSTFSGLRNPRQFQQFPSINLYFEDKLSSFSIF